MRDTMVSLLQMMDSLLERQNTLGVMKGTEQYVEGSEWILRDEGSEGDGSTVIIYFRNPDSKLCNVDFVDGKLKGTSCSVSLDLLKPVGSTETVKPYNKEERVRICDSGSIYDGKLGYLDGDVVKGKEIYVKLDTGERIFTYTKYIRHIS